ncbi:MAG: endonuclease domain-containing protein [Gammaproteobacteria bacterium]
MNRPRWRSSETIQLRARELRRAMTTAEMKLWRHLRYGQLGMQFRRQHAVGPCIVDFFCAKARLVVEVDGDSHGDPAQTEYDSDRTRLLSEQKQYRVIRFWNHEVLYETEAVVARIAARRYPHPDLPPLRRGGNWSISLPCPRFLRTGEGGVGARPLCADQACFRPQRLHPHPTLPRYAGEGTGDPLPCPRFSRTGDGGASLAVKTSAGSFPGTSAVRRA